MRWAYEVWDGQDVKAPRPLLFGIAGVLSFPGEDLLRGEDAGAMPSALPAPDAVSS